MASALNMKQECAVCGFMAPLSDVVCPRCGTIFPDKRMVCERCGRIFSSCIPICPNCGKVPGSDEDEIPEGLRVAAIERFTLIPGITEEMAGRLYDRGIRTFAGLVERTLPENQRQRGLHRILARRILLSGLKQEVPSKDVKTLTCTRCHGPLGKEDTECPICGAPVGYTLAELEPEFVETKLDEYLDDLRAFVFEAVKKTGAFPPERTEVSQAIAQIREDQLVRAECLQQIDAWRRKGFEVAGLRELLDESIEAFKEKSIAIIKRQINLKSEDGSFRCPLCQAPLQATAQECPNCGAKFE